MVGSAASTPLAAPKAARSPVRPSSQLGTLRFCFPVGGWQRQEARLRRPGPSSEDDALRVEATTGSGRRGDRAEECAALGLGGQGNWSRTGRAVQEEEKESDEPESHRRKGRPLDAITGTPEEACETGTDTPEEAREAREACEADWPAKGRTAGVSSIRGAGERSSRMCR